MFRNDHDGQHDNDSGGARSGGWHSQYGQLAATTRHGDGHREETPHERRVRRRLEDAQERAWCVARIQKLDQEEANRQERKRQWREWNWACKNLESNTVALLFNSKGKGKRGKTRPTPPSTPSEGYHGANAAVRGRGDTPGARAKAMPAKGAPSASSDFAADHTDTAVEDVRSEGATASRDDAPSDDGRSSVHDAPRDDDAMETRSIGRHKEPYRPNRSGLAPLSALRGDDRGSRPYLADDDDDNAYLDDDFESGPDAPEPDDRESAEEADREHEHSRKRKRSGLAPLSAVTKSQSQAQLSRSWSSAAVAVIGRGKDRNASKGTGNCSTQSILHNRRKA